MRIEALYHAFEYAGSRFGSTRIWQHSGAKLQHILYIYQVSLQYTQPSGNDCMLIHPEGYLRAL